MESDHNLPPTADIRQFLTSAFNDEELTMLCFDYFRGVYDDFTVGMTKGQKIQLLLDRCVRREEIPNLLASMQSERPKQYAKVFTWQLVQPYVQQPPVRDSRQVFISNCYKDAVFANRLADDLVRHGWHTWIAPSSIQPGEKWVEAINRGLDTSGIFVLVLTPAAMKSTWVRTEADEANALAADGQMRFIVLDVERSQAPPLWRAHLQISFRDRYEVGLDVLLRKLKTLETPEILEIRSDKPGYLPEVAIKRYESLRPLRAFLCHSSQDKPVVRRLYHQLRAEGVDSWLDEEKLLPGQKWEQEIPKAIRAADIVIVCLSRASISKAGYVQKEIKYALDVADEQPDGTIYLIPLRLDECNVPDRLESWQWVNLFDERGYDRLMRSLRARADSLGLTMTPVDQ